MTTNMLSSLMVNTDHAYTVIEFSEKAKVSRQAVNKAIKQKRIEATLVGKTYLIDKSQLPRFLARRKK